MRNTNVLTTVPVNILMILFYSRIFWYMREREPRNGNNYSLREKCSRANNMHSSREEMNMPKYDGEREGRVSWLNSLMRNEQKVKYLYVYKTAWQISHSSFSFYSYTFDKKNMIRKQKKIYFAQDKKKYLKCLKISSEFIDPQMNMLIHF